MGSVVDGIHDCRKLCRDWHDSVSIIIVLISNNQRLSHIIKSAQRPRGAKVEEETLKYTICLPYVSGLSEDVRRVCQKFDIRTVFSTISTLRQQLTRVKDVDPPLRKPGVVYRVPCSCGKQYIGKRALGTCIKKTSVCHQERRNREVCHSRTCLG